MTARSPRAFRAAQARSQSSSWPAAVSVGGSAQAGPVAGAMAVVVMRPPGRGPGGAGRRGRGTAARRPTRCGGPGGVGEREVGAVVGAAALRADVRGGRRQPRDEQQVRGLGVVPGGDRVEPGGGRGQAGGVALHAHALPHRRLHRPARAWRGGGPAANRDGGRRPAPPAMRRRRRRSPRRRPPPSRPPRAGRSRRAGSRRGRRWPRTRRSAKSPGASSARPCRSRTPPMK